MARAIRAGNSLGEKFPHLIENWCTERNAPLTPFTVSYGSTKKVWWQCPESADHVYSMSLNKKTSGRGCPCCAGYLVVESNSLLTKFPSVALELLDDPTKNPLSARELYHGSHKSVWWQCPKHDDHRYEMPVYRRTQMGHNCPGCSGSKVFPSTSLKTLHPEIAEEYDEAKNGRDALSEFPQSNSKRWWICQKYQLEPNRWKQSPNSRLRHGGASCPYCSGKKLAAHGENSLAALHPELALSWSNKNRKSSGEVVHASSKKFYWDCPTCDSAYKMSIRHRSYGHACPYCAGKATNETNNLKYTHPEIAMEWHPELNDDIKPTDVLPGSTAKVFWQCKKNPEHIWLATVNNRTKPHSATGCPACSATTLQGESRMYDIIVQETSFKPTRQVSPEWLGRQHLDVYIEELALAFEYNGEQHYRPIEFFGGQDQFDRQRELDSRKQKLCDENGVSLVVIPFDMSLNDQREKVRNAILKSLKACALQ